MADFIRNMPVYYTVGISDYYFDLKKAILAADLIAEILLEPGGHNFLETIFFTTIPEVFLLSKGNIKGLFYGMTFPHFRKLIKSKGKLINALNATGITIVEQEIKNNEQQSDQSVFYFGRIKQELLSGLEYLDIKIPLWGKGFSEGRAALVNRVALISQRYSIILKEMDVISSQIGQHLNIKDKQAHEALLQVTRDHLYTLLLDFKSIKIDLLTLSHSLDLYQSELNRVQSEANSYSQTTDFFIQSKKLELSNQSVILRTFTESIPNLELEYMKFLNYLNDLELAIHLDHTVPKFE